MKEKKLSLEHISLISSLLAHTDVLLSEYYFANLYLFREKHNYCVIDKNGNFFLSGITYDGVSFLMPLCDLSLPENAGYFSSLLDEVHAYDMIYPIPEKWLEKFPSDLFSFSSLDDDSDYLYPINTLASFSGRKLHGKRNLVYQFLREYNSKTLDLNENNIPLAQEVLAQWQKESGETEEQTDFVPCTDALLNLEALGLIGSLILADNKPLGFIIGEANNFGHCVIHFAKGNSGIKGIYQYMISTFAQKNVEKCSFVNLEQDLGKEGLRAMKKSYQPCSMLSKYRVLKK